MSLKDLIYFEKNRRYKALLTLQALNINKLLEETNNLNWEEFKVWCKKESGKEFNKNKRKIQIG